MVSRTARACTSGMKPMTSKPASRKPTAMYMIGSIMERSLLDRGVCPAAKRYSRPGIGRPPSERVPGCRGRELEIADIGAEPEAPPGADRNDDDVVCRQRGHAEPADEVSGAVDSREALVHRP